MHIDRRLRDLSEQTQFNKTYGRNLENARRMAWEQNLVEIYKHNLMAAAGHHSYTLRDNHIADLDTRQYIREMVSDIINDRNASAYKRCLSLCS